MSFSDSEKARIKYFLSYPDWSSTAQSIQLGYPAASQPAFLVDDAFHRLTPSGEVQVRHVLCECEAVERQISTSRKRLEAAEVGNVKLNAGEFEALQGQLKFWALRLASTLGVVSNPYSQYEHLGGGGGRNATVIG
jgi:hypothetical protein